MSKAPPIKIFVVEDNEWYGELVAHHLSQNPEYEVQRFTTAQDCLAQVPEQPDIITLDYSLPDARGEQLLRQLLERLPEVSVIVISGQEDISTAVQMLRQGAYDYLVKDNTTLDRLWELTLRISQQVRLRQENARLREQVAERNGTGEVLLGEHESMQHVRTLIAKAAATSSLTVSISGETGTGKELVAKAIHYQSDRAARPFVAVNMAAIPRELLESELFGHEKGAFTGAVARRVGRFEEATGGTLFLDEIADLDMSLQAKLLRVLQERTVTRVGGNQPIPFEVRVVVATHRDLLAEVQAGRFREDLYYRLLGLPIVLPPLRQRGEDVLLLADTFVQNFGRQQHLPLRRFTEKARRSLLAHAFPGNVRELKAVVELAAVLAEGERITSADLPLRTGGPGAGGARPTSLREQTRAIMQACLDELQGDVLATAARLEISKSKIYRMIQNRELRVK